MGLTMIRTTSAALTIVLIRCWTRYISEGGEMWKRTGNNVSPATYLPVICAVKCLNMTYVLIWALISLSIGIKYPNFLLCR